MVYKNNPNLNDLIMRASQKAGVSASDLKNTIDTGKLDNLISKLNKNDAQKFQNIISNPDLCNKFLNTPQAQNLIKQFMKQQ